MVITRETVTAEATRRAQERADRSGQALVVYIVVREDQPVAWIRKATEPAPSATVEAIPIEPR